MLSCCAAYEMVRARLYGKGEATLTPHLETTLRCRKTANMRDSRRPLNECFHTTMVLLAWQ